MTLSNDIVKAILAMDSYNRGYGAGIDTLPDDTDGSVKIGSATIYETLGDSGAEEIGFYGIAYQIKDESGNVIETIISYRGTNDADSIDDLFTSLDVWHGWSLGIGQTGSEQGQMAMEFYQEVAGIGNWLTANISLTGHSLGGGLAGYIASIYDQDAVLFDTMSFDDAADTINMLANQSSLLSLAYYGVYPEDVPDIDEDGIIGYHLEGEALEGLLQWRATVDEEVGLGATVDLVTGPDAVARHDMASLVIAMYGESISATSDWEEVAPYFWPILYNDSFAEQIGVDVETGQLAADHKYSQILRQIIAYSAIDVGNDAAKPFGDTAIRALYNDADDLGGVIADVNTSGMISYVVADLNRAMVHYAGRLALEDSEIDENPSHENGVFNITASDLVVDFRDDTWKAGSATLPDMFTRKELLENFLTYSGLKTQTLADMKHLWADDVTAANDNHDTCILRRAA